MLTPIKKNKEVVYMNQEKEEVFIVQNVTQGPVCISDLGK